MPKISTSATPDVTASNIKGVVLSWFGIVGGAITLFSNVSTLLDIANWARWLVYQWKLWTLAIWQFMLSWAQIEVSAFMASLLSLIFFIGVLALSVRIRSGERPNIRNAFGFGQEGAFRRVIYLLLTYVALGVAAFVATKLDLWAPVFKGWDYLRKVIEHTLTQISLPEWLANAWPIYAAVCLGVATAGWVLISIVRFGLDLRKWPESTDRSLAIALVSIIALCFLLPTIKNLQDIQSVYNVGIFLAMAALAIAPSRPLNQRLLYVVIGLGVLVGLNELSKLGIDFKAPAVPV
jgi:hypothetical protein